MGNMCQGKRYKKNVTTNSWETITVIKIHHNLSNSKKIHFKFYYELLNCNFGFYETPWTPFGRFVEENYQYDIHYELNSHDSHKVISIHRGRKPRVAILNLYFIPDLSNLIMDFICQ